jgi:hypothetical protein
VSGEGGLRDLCFGMRIETILKQFGDGWSDSGAEVSEEDMAHGLFGRYRRVELCCNLKFR